MLFCRMDHSGCVFLVFSFILLVVQVIASLNTCNLDEKLRFDCYPETIPKVKENCEARGCCFDPHINLNDDVPWCFYPSDYPTYTLQSFKKTYNGYNGVLTINPSFHHPFGPVIANLSLEVVFEQENRMRFRLTDASRERYEVPIETPSGTSVSSEEAFFDIDFRTNRFGLIVSRKSTGAVIFNSNIAPLIYTDQYLEISTTLPTTYIYGLGERHEHALVDTNWKRNVYWARDEPPTAGVNLYGDHSFYIGIENDGNAYGVFFLNSNAKEVVTQPAPALTWRSIGGIIDFYVFFGPTPDKVVQQYTDVVGKPFLPPMWSLGFHLCRWGYGSSKNTTIAVQKMRAAGIPQDVQWNDIDYMDSLKDFTYDPSNYDTLPDMVDNLHENGQHYVMIIDPGVSNQQPAGSYPPYDDGIASKIFIMHPSEDKPVEGVVWPGKTVFPDFTNPASAGYWEKQLKSYHDKVAFDGVWIDMNEPSNMVDGSTSGCPNNTLEHPAYTPKILGDMLAARTLCASSRQYNNGTHYNLHGLTGLFEMKATSEALVKIRNKRPFVISRSTFPSAGRYGGHWSGDIASTWDDLKQSIVSVLNFNMFGIPMIGADICGFRRATTEELCTRWMQLGAFYPFSRNHNTIGARAQAPFDFSSTAQENMRKALLTRYSFLPYLYSLFYQSHLTGSTVARGLFAEFPHDKITMSIDNQFMWGSGLMIAPVIEENATSVRTYFPAGMWYFLYGQFGQKILSIGNSLEFSVTLSDIPLYARGGSIIPRQHPSTTTTETKTSGISLMLAPCQMGMANGFLFWDTGDGLDTVAKKEYLNVNFSLKNNTLVSEVITSYEGVNPILTDLYLFDASPDIKSVYIDGTLVISERMAFNLLHVSCYVRLSQPFKAEFK